MFGFARILVRNKIVLVGIAAIIGFMFFGNKEQPKPSSPWSNAPVAEADSGSSAKGSLIDKGMKAVSGAAQSAGISQYTPTAIRDQTVGNVDSATGGLKKANHDDQ